MKKIITFLAGILLFLFVPVSPTYAMCPVCTLAVGAGVGLSRYLGIDDTVSGIWAGALVISISFWFVDWLRKKNYKFPIYLSVIFWTAFTYIPLWKAGIIGHPFNVIWGIDKLIFGSIIGAVTFLLAVYADKKVRKIKGKHLFNFQKVVLPIALLLISSLILRLITM